MKQTMYMQFFLSVLALSLMGAQKGWIKWWTSDFDGDLEVNSEGLLELLGD